MRLPARLLQRSPDAHKRDFGHVFIVAGSAGFSGAAVLCAEAALRSGAGLVSLGVPRGINNAIIKIKPAEIMTLPLPQTMGGALSLAAYSRIKAFAKNTDVLAIGPGLTQDKNTQALARKVIAGLDLKLVIDADGLNALTGHLGLLRKAAGKRPRGAIIITPHPGEMARLLGTTAKYVQMKRKQVSKKFAAECKIVVVLKGHNTVVADHSGHIYINRTGNPGMATAGSGDVLTGMIAAFLAQGLDSFAAAKYAVYLHGLAGDLAANELTQISLIASDIIDKIPEAIKRCN